MTDEQIKQARSQGIAEGRKLEKEQRKYSPARSRGADIELIEFTDDLDDAGVLVIPNTAIVNGVRTLLTVDDPWKIEMDGADTVVTLRIQVRSLRVEARSASDITAQDIEANAVRTSLGAVEARVEQYRKTSILSDRAVGTLSSDWTHVSVADELGVTYWTPVLPSANEKVERTERDSETPEQRWIRQDREYFDLVGKKVRIVEGSEPVGAIGTVQEYVPEGGAYKARFGVTFVDQPGVLDGQRTYIRDAFEVVQDV